jgi:peptide-methionine (S)-S-oxide reductase
MEFYLAEEYHQNYARENPDNPYLQNVLFPKLKKLGLRIPTKGGE